MKITITDDVTGRYAPCSREVTTNSRLHMSFLSRRNPAQTGVLLIFAEFGFVLAGSSEPVAFRQVEHYHKRLIERARAGEDQHHLQMKVSELLRWNLGLQVTNDCHLVLFSNDQPGCFVDCRNLEALTTFFLIALSAVEVRITSPAKRDWMN